MELGQCREGDVVKVYHDRNGYLTSDVQTMPERITTATVVAVSLYRILLGWSDPDGEDVPACVWDKEVMSSNEMGYHKFIQGGYAWGFYTERSLVIAERITTTTVSTKRVKCMDDSGTSDLTIGKEYEVVSEMTHDYLVVGNSGGQAYYLKKRFQPVSDKVVEPATPAAPTLPPPPPFDFDAYNGIKHIRKVHLP